MAWLQFVGLGCLASGPFLLLYRPVQTHGHHGSRNAITDAWLSRVHPHYAAISCGAHNTFGHSSPQTLARLTVHHVPAFITAKNGAITFESDGQTVTVHPYLRAK